MSEEAEAGSVKPIRESTCVTTDYIELEADKTDHTDSRVQLSVEVAQPAGPAAC